MTGRVVVSGASGLIGTRLVESLTTAQWDVLRLVRRPARAGEIQWDPAASQLRPADLEDVDAVVNLAGAGLAEHRWTDEYKQELVDSRVFSTSLLSTTLAQLDRPPAVLVSASAIGIYGARGDEVIDETKGPGDDFLARLCVEWEQATAPAQEAGVRVAHIRTGIVLSPDGGALAKQLPLFKLGLGGKFGSGRQWQSWISIDDEVAAIEHVLDRPIDGPVNLTAPGAVTNERFVEVLASVLRRPHLPWIPSFGPKLVLGRELAEHLLFTGQRVAPAVLTSTGYSFRHPDLEGALRAMLDRPARD